MKHLLILLCVVLPACASNTIQNTRTMIRSQDKRNYEAVDSKEFKAEDKNLIVTYTPDITDAGTGFVFKNKTGDVIKILWDESAFVNPAGQSGRVIHTGIRLMDSAQTQPPSIIPPMKSMADDIIPASNVNFDYGKWMYTPLCGTHDWTWTLQDAECIGKTFEYVISYEVNGTKKTISAKFKYISKEPLPAAELDSHHNTFASTGRSARHCHH